MSDIPEEALNTIEEKFGARFVPHAPGDAEPHAEQPLASVFPESAEEVESLMKLAARHSIPLIARGAGYGTNGLPHERSEIHHRRLAGRERVGGRLF